MGLSPVEGYVSSNERPVKEFKLSDEDPVKEFKLEDTVQESGSDFLKEKMGVSIHTEEGGDKGSIGTQSAAQVDIPKLIVVCEESELEKEIVYSLEFGEKVGAQLDGFRVLVRETIKGKGVQAGLK